MTLPVVCIPEGKVVVQFEHERFVSGHRFSDAVVRKDKRLEPLAAADWLVSAAAEADRVCRFLGVPEGTP